MLQNTNLTYKNQLSFYTLTANYQKEKLRKQPTYNNTKNNKIRINLIKEAKYLYNENYKTLMEEIEDKRTISHVHRLEKLILLKCSYYLKPSIKSMQSPLKF